MARKSEPNIPGDHLTPDEKVEKKDSVVMRHLDTAEIYGDDWSRRQAEYYSDQPAESLHTEVWRSGSLSGVFQALLYKMRGRGRETADAKHERERPFIQRRNELLQARAMGAWHQPNVNTKNDAAHILRKNLARIIHGTA